MGFLLLDSRRRLAALAPVAGWVVEIVNTGAAPTNAEAGDPPDYLPLTFSNAEATQIGTYQPAAPYDAIDQVIRRQIIEDWLVDFRVEADDSRMEIVTAHTSLFSHTVANYQDPVHVTYKFNGETIAVDECYKFFYRSRIRQVFVKDGGGWVKAAQRHRPIVADPATLIAAGQLPPMGETGLPISYNFTHVPYEPMGSSGAQKGMTAGGQTSGLNTGLITGHQAAYLLEALGIQSAGTFSDCEATMFAQAETSGSIPWHLIDEATGKPIDIHDHPSAQIASDSIIPAGGYHFGDRSEQVDGWGVHTQSLPSFTYVPYLLTGDLYYLEESQNAACSQIATHTNMRQSGTGFPIIWRIQARAIAWMLRDNFQAALISPETDTTGVLLPKSYSQTIIDNTRAWYTTEWVESLDSNRATFREIGQEGSVSAPWGARGMNNFQHDYAIASVGWAVLMGHSAWGAFYDWQRHFLTQRMDTESGWNRFWFTLRFWVTDGTDTPITWSESASNLDALYTENDPGAWPPPANTIWNEQNGAVNVTYAMIARAALVIGIHAGKTEWGTPHDWLLAEMIAHQGGSNNNITPQYSIVPPEPE